MHRPFLKIVRNPGEDNEAPGVCFRKRRAPNVQQNLRAGLDGGGQDLVLAGKERVAL